MAVASGFPSNVLPDQYALAQLMLVDPAANARKYAWCTDLFGGAGDMCLSDGVNWKPVRPFAVQTIANANSDQTFICMADAPTIIEQGTLTASRVRTLSTQYAYKGARFRMKREAGGLFNMLINGVVPMGLNSWADFEFNGTAWVQTASGGLL